MSSLRPLRGLIAALLTITAGPAFAGWNHLDVARSIDVQSSGLSVACPPAMVRISAINDHVVRVRLAPDGAFGRDFSWAVEDLAARGTIVAAPPVGDGDAAQASRVYQAGDLRIRINTEGPLRIAILDEEGRELTVDEPSRGMGWQQSPHGDVAAVRAWQQLPDGTAIYGLGEKTGGLDQNGRAWEMWNTDEGAYAPDEDPLYKSIPFFVCEREGRFWGVFFDNPWRTSFDFGKDTRNVLSFGAEGGELNYYVIAGPHPKDVIQRYTALTGRLPLPPKWAIGYHQCRYSYMPADRVREIARTFRAKRIPCDALYFDIDYMDGYRCFTWHPRRFPDPAGLIDELNADGFHTVAIIDPGIKREAGYAVFDSGEAIDAWVQAADGAPYVGRVWPGACTFPDFTAARVRNWWADLFPPFINACGLDGVWNDMNEPANFAGPNKTLPLDCQFHNAGEPASHRACHNIYGMQMTRATYEGLQRTRPDKRVFTLTRAAYAGGQRYGAAWTGDNVSSWAHLKLTIPMLLNLGVSGLPFVGPDIGGFVGGATPELYARWIQVGALYPFSRTHTACNNPDQEPWSYGPEVEAVARASIERRYRWLPYLYTVFEEAARTGLPIMRPQWLEDPGARGWMMESSFLLGPDIYVAPRLTPGREPFWVEVPAGVWFDGNTGLIDGGPRWVQVPGDLDTLPHYFRGGAVIPTQSVVQHTGETPAEPLILDAWLYGQGEGTLYEDDGVSLAFERGEYRRTRFTCRKAADHVAFVVHAPEGSYVPPPRRPMLRLHGLEDAVAYVAIGQGAGLDGLDAEQTQRLADALKDLSGNRMRVRAGGTETTLQVYRSPADGPLGPDPGAFAHDAVNRFWSVRLPEDAGEPTLVLAMLSPDKASRESVVLDFGGPEDAFPQPPGAGAPEYAHGIATIPVRWAGDIRVRLPRLAIPADLLDTLVLRVATEHTERVQVRFRNTAAPTVLGGEGISIALTADGSFHNYKLNLGQADPAAWHGRVYHVELVFTDGVQGGEKIRLERIAFESSADADGA